MRRFLSVQKVLWTLVFALLPFQVALATSYLVKPDGSGDFPNIQAAIAAVSGGDEVLLANGTYTGDGNRDLDFLGKSIRLASQSGSPSDCILDCEGTSGAPHRGVNFHNGETAASILEGITVTGGSASDGGAIVVEENCSPLIHDCILRGNTSDPDGGYGGAIYCYGSPVISDCQIADNEAGNRGGGIYAGDGPGADAVITNCVIRGNIASDGGGVHCRGTVTITGCLIESNSTMGVYNLGGGVSFRYHTGVMSGCTLVGNQAGSAAGIAFYGDGPTVQNCIVTGCSSGGGLGWGYGGPNSAPTISCCDIWGNTGGFGDDLQTEMIDGGGIIHFPPLFCDGPNGDYGLHADSPCTPHSAENPDCDLVGAYPVSCGPTPVERSSWGRIKASFR